MSSRGVDQIGRRVQALPYRNHHVIGTQFRKVSLFRRILLSKHAGSLSSAAGFDGAIIDQFGSGEIFNERTARHGLPVPGTHVEGRVAGFQKPFPLSIGFHDVDAIWGGVSAARFRPSSHRRVHCSHPAYRHICGK
jgi:hypothetical protein